MPNDQVIELFFVCKPPKGADNKFCVITGYLTRRQFNIFAIKGSLYFGKRNIVSRQFIWLQPNAHRISLLPKNIYAAYFVDGLKTFYQNILRIVT